MKFRTVLQLGGKTATGFAVPADVVAALGRGKRPPVVVQIGSYSYRSTVAAYADVFMLPLAAEHREAIGAKAGDELEVLLALDTEPREVTLPADLAAALGAEPTAEAAFQALSYSNQRAIVLSVEGAKAAETRARRIAKAVSSLASS